jgi:hypothetical protein
MRLIIELWCLKRILVSLRGLFWKPHFCMVKYLSFLNSSFAFWQQPSRKRNWTQTQCNLTGASFHSQGITICNQRINLNKYFVNYCENERWSYSLKPQDLWTSLFLLHSSLHTLVYSLKQWNCIVVNLDCQVYRICITGKTWCGNIKKFTRSWEWRLISYSQASPQLALAAGNASSYYIPP